MKCLGFVLLLGFISLGAIVGCNDNGGGGSSQDTQLLREEVSRMENQLKDIRTQTKTKTCPTSSFS